MENRYFDYPDDAVASIDGTGSSELGLLVGSSEADWSLLFDYGERRFVQPDERIIERGIMGRSMFIVLSGEFRIVAPAHRGGAEMIVRILDAGAIVGEVGFAVGGTRSNTIIANELSEIFELDWESLERLATAHPALGVRFLSDVLSIVAARTRAAERL
jgi:CRP-like cAMP-binding protein